jgi:hypothetical protein
MFIHEGGFDDRHLPPLGQHISCATLFLKNDPRRIALSEIPAPYHMCENSMYLDL